jgi:hypothetical protein
MSKLIKVPMIQSMILEIRRKRVILDSDLAILYRVPTKVLNQAVKRNRERFPEDFMFQLTKDEYAFLKSQIVTSERIPEKKRKLPYVFTRNGANMVCTVLRSSIAAQRSVQIMRAFSAMEEIVSQKRRELVKSPDALKKLSIHSRAIMRLFQDVKMNAKEVARVKKIQKEMISLLQQMVFASLKAEK